MNRESVSSGTVWEDEVGYSRAVRVGDRIEVSGTTATGEDGEIVGEDDPYTQASKAIGNVERALEALDATLTDVVRTRTFVTDIEHYGEVGRAHGEAFGDVKPATSMYEVAALVESEMLVEIEATAIARSERRP